MFLKILINKPTGKRPLGRRSHRLEDNIRMTLKEIGINTRNYIDLAQDRDYLESPCECDFVPPDSISHGVI